jgi:hypothetical protein
MKMLTATHGDFELEYLTELNGTRWFFIAQSGVVIASEFRGDNIKKLWNDIKSKPAES